MIPDNPGPSNYGLLNPAHLLYSQRRIITISPFSHRTVVVSHTVIAQQSQDKRSVRRTDTPLSVGNNLLVWHDTSLL